jgi:hypothetical protein
MASWTLPSTSTFPRQTPPDTGIPCNIFSPDRVRSDMGHEYPHSPGLKTKFWESAAAPWKRRDSPLNSVCR